MNRKVIILMVLGLVAVIVMVMASSSRPNHSTAYKMGNTSKQAGTIQPADDKSVVIQNYTFNPNPLKVKKGTTVTWTNTDTAKHNVEVDDGQPAGGPNGPLFGKNETYQFTFANAGIFKYHCSPHPYMHGSVEVTE
ncbi:MAG TPA: plastocyanin/azurin family copper-binding protein [Candidatus Saccharimonadia bacterium]